MLFICVIVKYLFDLAWGITIQNLFVCTFTCLFKLSTFNAETFQVIAINTNLLITVITNLQQHYISYKRNEGEMAESHRQNSGGDFVHKNKSKQQICNIFENDDK